MDTGTIIITSILILSCILPFIMMNTQRRKKDKQLLQALQKLATNNQTTISHFDLMSKAAIGIDVNKSQLFFYKNVNEHITTIDMILDNVKQCRLVKTQRKNASQTLTHSDIDKIELVFQMYDQQLEPIHIELYNVATDGFNINHELQIAQKWLSIIHEKVIV